MTLTKQDKEDIREILYDVLEQLVIPQLNAISEKLEEHDRHFDFIERKFESLS